MLLEKARMAHTGSGRCKLPNGNELVYFLRGNVFCRFFRGSLLCENVFCSLVGGRRFCAATNEFLWPEFTTAWPLFEPPLPMLLTVSKKPLELGGYPFGIPQSC